MRRLRLGLISMLTLSAAAVAFAQGSPASTATGTIGGKNPAWRAWANAATTLVTDGDLDIGGLAVPGGTCRLYAWLENPAGWQLLVNRQTGQWDLSYDPKQDLGRVKMTMAKPPTPVETLKYSITDQGGGNGELRLEWEHHVASVPIVVR